MQARKQKYRTEYIMDIIGLFQIKNIPKILDPYITSRECENV